MTRQVLCSTSPRWLLILVRPSKRRVVITPGVGIKIYFVHSHGSIYK
jgi:hypothetical protein